MSNKTDEIVKEMARLTMISGRINAVQEKNLTMFPLIFFNGVSSVRVEYDFSTAQKVGYEQDKSTLETTFSVENKAKPKVEYLIDMDETQDNSFMDKRFEALQNSVRKLFWTDTKVVIYINNKLVFESDKHV